MDETNTHFNVSFCFPSLTSINNVSATCLILASLSDYPGKEVRLAYRILANTIRSTEAQTDARLPTELL